MITCLLITILICILIAVLIAKIIDKKVDQCKLTKICDRERIKKRNNIN
jgi:hypothetical protein